MRTYLGQYSIQKEHSLQIVTINALKNFFLILSYKLLIGRFGSFISEILFTCFYKIGNKIRKIIF